MKPTKIELIEVLEDLIQVLGLKRNKDDDDLLEITDDDTEEEINDLIKKAIPMILPKEDTLKLNTWKFVKLTNPGFWQEHKKYIPKFEKVPEEDLVEEDSVIVPEETQQEVANRLNKFIKKSSVIKINKPKKTAEENILAPKDEEDEEVVDAFLPEIVKDDVVPDETPKELFIEDKFKNACPKITDEEFKALETLILKDGAIYDPIIVWDNTIVDGHNRYVIARKHGLDFKTEEKSFVTEMDAVIWIKDHALSQRNLSDFARYELVKDLQAMLGGIGKQKQKEKGVKKSTEEKHNTRDVVAKKAKLSPSQVAKAKHIDEVADEETKQELRDDKTTIGKAYKKVYVRPEDKKKTGQGTEKIKIANATRTLRSWCKTYAKYKFLKDSTIAVDAVITDLEILEKAY